MHCLVITTCDKDEAERIKKALLKEKLAACVSSFDVNSSYIWKGKIEESEETMLLIKTRKDKWDVIKKKIIELHSYELPEIICLDMEGSEEYMKWIDGVLK